MTSNIQEDKLREFFRPEFLNRIDDIVKFHSLTQDNLLEITDILLAGLQKNLQEKTKMKVSLQKPLMQTRCPGQKLLLKKTRVTPKSNQITHKKHLNKAMKVKAKVKLEDPTHSKHNYLLPINQN